MESWNRLTAVRGDKGGGDWLKDEGFSQKNVYEGPMDMDNGVGIDYGNGGQAGQREAKGENWDNCNSINNKTS